MSYREVPFAHNEYYHVYNRGNSRQNIFLDNADFKRFQDLLYLANTIDSVSVRNSRRTGVYEIERGKPFVDIGAYCLMPNHFHILITPLVENGVSLFMQKISTGYVMYFNKRYQRTGALFEGKFKSRHADTDEYLKYLFSYIHLNPLKLKHLDWKNRFLHEPDLIQHAREYFYSSYQDYLNDIRNETMILGKESFPEYFKDVNAWEKEMSEWIKYTEHITEARPRSS